MNRSNVLASITAGALVIAAGAVAAGANVGIFDLADRPSPVGRLAPVAAAAPNSTTTPTTIEPTVVTVYTDDLAADPATTPAPAATNPSRPSPAARPSEPSEPVAVAPSEPPAPATTAPVVRDDRRDDRSDDTDDDHSDDHSDDGGDHDDD